MTDVLQLLEAYASAALAKDARAMLDLYRPDVRVFDLWGTWSYEGADAWRRAIEDWFGSLGSESVRVSFDDVRHRGARDTAVVTAFVTYEAWSAEGKKLREMQNRLTWVLLNEDGSWKVAHQHTSAPISDTDVKPIFRRA